MTRKITNIADSKHRKLLHLAQMEKKDFNALQKRYLQERFLYRLSISKFKQNFILKGGLLLITIDLPSSRPTMDIDFLAKNISRDATALKGIMKEICEIPLNDGILFDTDSISTEEIDKDGDYNGVRVKVTALMGTRKTLVSLDLGFNDKVIPTPREISFPTILEEEAPQLNAYCLETIIAEKFEAMTKLALANSRMKDFYDVYKIFTTHQIDLSTLKESLQATFGQRKTKITKNPVVFTRAFYADPNKQIQWQAFLTKHNILDTPTDLQSVVKLIKSNLQPILAEILAKKI